MSEEAIEGEQKNKQQQQKSVLRKIPIYFIFLPKGAVSGINREKRAQKQWGKRKTKKRMKEIFIWQQSKINDFLEKTELANNENEGIAT